MESNYPEEIWIAAYWQIAQTNRDVGSEKKMNKTITTMKLIEN